MRQLSVPNHDALVIGLSGRASSFDLVAALKAAYRASLEHDDDDDDDDESPGIAVISAKAWVIRLAQHFFFIPGHLRRSPQSPPVELERLEYEDLMPSLERWGRESVAPFIWESLLHWELASVLSFDLQLMIVTDISTKEEVDLIARCRGLVFNACGTRCDDTAEKILSDIKTHQKRLNVG